MNPAAPFIRRPVATSLLTLGVALAGIVAYFLLPVAALPQVDFPTVAVMASMAGASPETMATSVATPLERHLGQIADVSEMTSSSSVGNTRVILQFGLSRDIDGAARDVQAAINAARADLPTSLKSNPTYRKVNPADAPIQILALTSDTLTPGQIYDAASTVLAQKLSQIDGVGQVSTGGGSLPAIRVEVNPTALFKYGLSLEDLRAALAATNVNSPKGLIEVGQKRFQVETNDQAQEAEIYRNLIVAWRDDAPVRVRDVADVRQSVEDIRHLGLANGKPAVLVMIFRQPGANVVETVDRIRALLPNLRASVPASIDIDVEMDPTNTIRASLADVQTTLLITIFLVIFVVYLFLRDARAALVPSVAVPVSLIGTFAIMYLMGYGLDNLSLMALVVCTGFVVDDAIVVVENIMRHIEAGMPRFKAALQGAGEVAFTVLSMSLSLIAVFIPILLMGGIVGRLFRAFAVTLSVAILVSLVVSMTTTPMLAARLLHPSKDGNEHGLLAWAHRCFDCMYKAYDASLAIALRHEKLVLLSLLATVALNVYLFTIVPKGFFPQQDTGRIMGSIVADQSVSFQAMEQKLRAFAAIVRQDPSVANVTAFTGGNTTNTGNMFIALKPRRERSGTADEIITRLRQKLAVVPGATLFLQAAQDIRMGGRPGSAQYQYTLQSDNLNDLRQWTPKIVEALHAKKDLADVSSDQMEAGLETELSVDRDAAMRLGLSMNTIDNTLYDAFGQRQVSTLYKDRNQYHVVMTFAPSFLEDATALNQLYVSASGSSVSGSEASSATLSAAAKSKLYNQIGGVGRTTTSTGSAISTAASSMIPLGSFASVALGKTPLSVNHQGHFAANTISFNLPPGKALGQAVETIRTTMRAIGVPQNVQGTFQGSAKMFQDSFANQGLLILAALLAIYIVLGILYESLIHPITILSTLPSAGVGAVLALLLFKIDFTIMALIGVILLIGIVKKNAIMMIDFALAAERQHGADPATAIREACEKRFRPIMMTTMAALFGALPLALGHGEGAELRQPLGISIVGGLLVSQLLTLYTTPVVYLYLDRLRHWGLRKMRIDTPRLGDEA
jgi:multidrug efflux pump